MLAWEDPQAFPRPLTQTGVPTTTAVAMKQPSPPRVTMVPWIRVQGLEVLLLVTTTIMESTTYVVGTGSPSMVRGEWCLSQHLRLLEGPV